jgi:hypothetical protein
MSSDKMNNEPVCAAVEGVDPIFVPHILKGAMACRFCRAVGPGMSLSQGYDAAIATWETEWPSDPEPRTYEAAMEVVDDELSYWGED